jgi:hypothetical protein
VNNGGTITEAVSSQPWSGDAVVHVSIVNWIKGEQLGEKKLIEELGTKGNTKLNIFNLKTINSSLSSNIDLSHAKELQTNAQSQACYQGQTHGHEGFIITPEYAEKLMDDPKCVDYIHPYLTGDNLLSNLYGVPSRYAISLNHCDNIIEAKNHGKAYSHIEAHVMPAMKNKADVERQKTGKDTGPRQCHFNNWWKYLRDRPEMIDKISEIDRYIACARVTKRPIFEFVSTDIRPNDALQVFAMEDDYSFGILQSILHWIWFKERCSTLKDDFRYTSNTVFDTFPWPQSPQIKEVQDVAKASLNLRKYRHETMENANWNLRELYRSLEIPGKNPLREMHDKLDKAVMVAYGIKKEEDPLKFLLDLNLDLAKRETDGIKIVGPGLPPCVKDPQIFISDDCIHM